MFAYKKFVIAEHERGLLFKDRRLSAVLLPGIYRRFDPWDRIAVLVHDLSEPEFEHPLAELFLNTAAETVAEHLHLISVGEQEVVLVYKSDTLSEVLPPQSRRVYWKGPVRVSQVTVDIREDYELDRKLAATLMQSPTVSRNSVYRAEVPDRHVGLLIVDGELVRSLAPGPHAFWTFNRTIRVEILDTRVQVMEIGGQEILSRDKVSLRVNLAAQYRVSDPVRARAELNNPLEWLYRELQFALRQAVGARTLDNLLGNKDGLDRAIFEAVAERAAENGFVVSSVGLKDVILPGDMKEILNQVVQAEKVAQANVIKRREETAATRSLLNTARLMDENPTLLRLKELEMLEKVTEKVDRLTVFGGLDGVLKDTVRINV
ncbi:MAG: slipin family protein [Chromatiales bacterium]|nr:slipin family protein [Chromatiales bacterium]